MMITITINLWYVIAVILGLPLLFTLIVLPILFWFDLAQDRRIVQRYCRVRDKKTGALAWTPFRVYRTDWLYARHYHWYARTQFFLVLKAQRLLGIYPLRRYRPEIPYSQAVLDD